MYSSIPMHHIKWNVPSMNHYLSSNEVHIWRIIFNSSKTETDRLSNLLSDDEINRSEKYFFEKDRKLYIAGRGILRKILSRYLEENPKKIKFNYSANGKPYIADSNYCKDLSFNFSQSGNQALTAITFEQKIGVDLEFIEQQLAWHDIADNFFTKEENSEIQSCSEYLRCKKFYTFWTRKEAFLKAIGTGLMVDPKDINVAMQGGIHPWIRLNGNLIEINEEWSLIDLDIAPDYAAALAVEGKKNKIRFLQYESASSIT